MTFEALTEVNPIEVYQFVYGTQVLRYTSNSEDIKVTNSEDYAGGVTGGAQLTFLAETIKRSEVEMSGEMNKSVIQLQTNKNNTVADIFISGTPTFPIEIKVWRMSEEGLGLDKLSVFQGRVTGCSFTGMEATLNCEPIYTQLQKAGLRRVYATTCAHSLYDMASCKVNYLNGGVDGWAIQPVVGVAAVAAVTEISIDPDTGYETVIVLSEAIPEVLASPGTHLPSFALSLTRGVDFEFTAEGEISVILTSTNGLIFDSRPYDTKTGLAVTHSQTALPESPAILHDTTAFYTGGLARLFKNGATDGSVHMITEHTRGKLTLIRALPTTELEHVTSIAISPGCDHYATTCKNKFGNIENFGGFPYMAAANPFAGTHVPIGG